jgi:hypothetical protein
MSKGDGRGVALAGGGGRHIACGSVCVWGGGNCVWSGGLVVWWSGGVEDT